MLSAGKSLVKRELNSRVSRVLGFEVASPALCTPAVIAILREGDRMRNRVAPRGGRALRSPRAWRSAEEPCSMGDRAVGTGTLRTPLCLCQPKYMCEMSGVMDCLLVSGAEPGRTGLLDPVLS